MAEKAVDLSSPAPEPGVEPCPKCGIEMEPIETSELLSACKGLCLCPKCYLVTWRDEAGIHLRQGVPMNAADSARVQPSFLSGEPEEC